MKCAFPECSTLVFITVERCHGAEFLRKKKLLSLQFWHNWNCLPGFFFLFFFWAGETLPVDLLEKESNGTFICNSVLWQYAFTETQAKNNVRKQTLLWYFISDFITTLLVVVVVAAVIVVVLVVVVPHDTSSTILTPVHIIWGAGCTFLCKCRLTD